MSIERYNQISKAYNSKAKEAYAQNDFRTLESLSINKDKKDPSKIYFKES